MCNLFLAHCYRKYGVLIWIWFWITSIYWLASVTLSSDFYFKMMEKKMENIWKINASFVQISRALFNFDSILLAWLLLFFVYGKSNSSRIWGCKSFWYIYSCHTFHWVNESLTQWLKGNFIRFSRPFQIGLNQLPKQFHIFGKKTTKFYLRWSKSNLRDEIPASFPSNQPTVSVLFFRLVFSKNTSKIVKQLENLCGGTIVGCAVNTQSYKTMN